MNKSYEHSFQKSVVSYLRKSGLFVFETDVMDGLKFCRNKKERISYIRHHQSMGYTNGQSDLVVIIPNEVIFIELKNGKKGVQSDSQKIFQQKIKNFGFKYLIWRDFDDVFKFLCKIKANKNKDL